MYAASEELLERCRAGDGAALAEVYAGALPQLERYVMSIGATGHDAETIAAEVLGDCLVGGPGREALIKEFREDAALTSWLGTICRNRYFEVLRKRRVHAAVVSAESGGMGGGARACVDEARDEGLIDMARGVLVEVFSKCDAADLVMLELVHAHGVAQRRLARLLGWTESRLSRHLAGVRVDMRRSVREAVARRDGALRMDWRDFAGVCERLLRRT
jgi:DNA-directed RNA polymerase specialized sigma24 family protein